MENKVIKKKPTALQQWKPFETGTLPDHLRIQKLRENHLIFARTSIDGFEKVFRYIFLLIGLRPKNYPDSSQAAVVIKVLVDHFGTHTTGELALAFELAICGRLSGIDGNAYQDFTPAFVTGIMRSYRKWASEIMRPYSEYKSPNEKRGLIQQEFDQFFVHDREPVFTAPAEIYDQLVYDGFMPYDAGISTGDKERIIQLLFIRAKQQNRRMLYRKD